MGYKDMTDEQLREIAEKRVEARNGFKVHLMVYVLVNLFLIVIYFVTTFPHHPWFVYSLFGWGVGLGAHAIETRNILKGGVDEVEAEIEKMKKM